MKSSSKTIDMSPEAIARRLDEVRALYRLCMSLARAKVVGPVEPDAKRSGAMGS